MLRVIVILYTLRSIQQACSQTTTGLVLPEERTTGLGCIPEGRTVSYECTVTDSTSPVIGSTIWSGSAFQCPSTLNQISLPHSQFPMVMSSCGGLQAMALRVDGDKYTSQLNVMALSVLNGTSLSCSLAGLTLYGSDVLHVGVPPPPPGPLSVSISSISSLIVSWSPPSGPVEGGVGGYVFGVTGEGCGCVSMNVSADTTSVTCSGWNATGQTCSFEVRTLSQDCEFTSTSLSQEIALIVCDPNELRDDSMSNSRSGTITVLGGVITYNGVVVGSTAYLMCDNAFVPGAASGNRTCLSNGTWSGEHQICASTQPNQNPAPIVVPIVLVVAVTIIMVILIIFLCEVRRRQMDVLMGGKTEILFKEGISAPSKISYPIDAVVYENVAYFRQFRTYIIHKYELSSQSWSTLPNCLAKDTSLVGINIRRQIGHGTDHLLHTIGGETRDGMLVADLYCFRDKWEMSPIPPMDVKRKQVTAVCDGKILIAAGGRGMKGPVKTVEVFKLDADYIQWKTVADLPRALFRASGSILGYDLYLFGGRVYDRERHLQVDVNSAYKVSLNKLVKSNPLDKPYKTLRQIPRTTLRLAYACAPNCIYAVGGSENDPDSEEAISSNRVYKYDPNRNLWKIVGQLNVPRCYCFAVWVAKKLVVVGGLINKPDGDITTSVEIGEVQKSSNGEETTF